MRTSMDSRAPKSEQVEEAATRWLARQQSDTWTDADQAQFDAWLEAATAHRIQYIRVTTAWEHTARMKALGAGVPSGVIPPRGSWGDVRFLRGALPERQTAERQVPVSGLSERFDKESLNSDNPETPVALTSNPARRWFNWSLSAAAALMLFAAGLYIFNAGWFGGTHYSTPVGGMDHVLLTDGSNVTLNTDTSIRVALNDKERRVELEQGEAFFDVAQDKSRPFVVYAGEKRVVAVGTQFSVRRDDDDIQVVVTEGRVNLAAAEIPSMPDRDAGRSEGFRAQASIPPSTFLDAGAIAQTAKSEIIVRPNAASEIEKLLSWRRGYVSFDDMPLADAVAEFNRYNTRKIFIEDPAIAAIRVGGNFRSNNTDAFLDLLQNGFPIAVEESDDKVVLKGR